jgi:hypothetical protein
VLCHAIKWGGWREEEVETCVSLETGGSGVGQQINESHCSLLCNLFITGAHGRPRMTKASLQELVSSATVSVPLHVIASVSGAVTYAYSVVARHETRHSPLPELRFKQVPQCSLLLPQSRVSGMIHALRRRLGVEQATWLHRPVIK